MSIDEVLEEEFNVEKRANLSLILASTPRLLSKAQRTDIWNIMNTEIVKSN